MEQQGPRPTVGPARGVLRVAPAAGTLEHHRQAPGAAVAPFVAHYWWVAWRLRAPFLAETLPHPAVHLVWEWPGREVELRAPSTQRFVRTLRGTGHVFGIKFRPGTFGFLSPGPLEAWVDRPRRFTTLAGRDGPARAPRIPARASFSEAVAIAEAWLLAVLPPLPREVEVVRDLVERMERDPTLGPVSAAAQRLGVGTRSLERRFARHVGAPPKLVLSRYRIMEAVERLKAPDPPALATLAAELGFSDQAHFSRTFKATIGRTPAQFRADAQRVPQAPPRP